MFEKARARACVPSSREEVETERRGVVVRPHVGKREVAEAHEGREASFLEVRPIVSCARFTRL